MGMLHGPLPTCAEALEGRVTGEEPWVVVDILRLHRLAIFSVARSWTRRPSGRAHRPPARSRRAGRTTAARAKRRTMLRYRPTYRRDHHRRIGRAAWACAHHRRGG